MGNVFRGSEIIELGIQIEKNGKDYYNLLISQSKNKGAREIFKCLADEEEKHIAVFQKILDSVAKYEPPESYPGEYFAYMNKLASEYVFTQENKGKQIAKDTTSDAEAVELGIGFEKGSIAFYDGMKKVVPEHNLKIVDRLIAEELEHLRKLSSLRESL